MSCTIDSDVLVASLPPTVPFAVPRPFQQHAA
jgi:hypothetical protein